MIDLYRENRDLEAATGLGSEAILAELGSTYLEKLARIQERPEGFASLLSTLYGPRGLLRQAGAALALCHRLGRLVALLPLCRTDVDAAVRLRREVLILRTFSREQVARNLGAPATPLVEAIAAVARTVARLHDFCLAATAIDTQVGLYRKVRNLKVAAGMADTWPTPRNVGDVVTFVLDRLSESAFVKSATHHYDSLCQAHAALLREDLWEAAERGYAAQDAPATLRDVTELDLTLEALSARLTDPAVDGGERRMAIGELYALLATSRVTESLGLARAALGPIQDQLRARIDAEVRG
jgi:hypothetical protein